MSFSSKELKKLLLRRLPSWNSLRKASERSPGWEKDLRIGPRPGSPSPAGGPGGTLSGREGPAAGCGLSERGAPTSNSALRRPLTCLNFSMHSSMSAGGAFLWATVTRPQKSTSNFLANVSSNSDGQRSSSWRAIFPAWRMELMISGTCGERERVTGGRRARHPHTGPHGTRSTEAEQPPPCSPPPCMLPAEAGVRGEAGTAEKPGPRTPSHARGTHRFHRRRGATVFITHPDVPGTMPEESHAHSTPQGSGRAHGTRSPAPRGQPRRQARVSPTAKPQSRPQPLSPP